MAEEQRPRNATDKQEESQQTQEGPDAHRPGCQEFEGGDGLKPSGKPSAMAQV